MTEVVPKIDSGLRQITTIPEQSGTGYLICPVAKSDIPFGPTGTVKILGPAIKDLNAGEGGWPAVFNPDSFFAIQNWTTISITEGTKDTFSDTILGGTTFGPTILVPYTVTGNAGTGWTNTSNISADDSSYAYTTPPTGVTYTFFADWSAASTLSSHPEYRVYGLSVRADTYISSSVSGKLIAIYEVYGGSRLGGYNVFTPTAINTYQTITRNFVAPTLSNLASTCQLEIQGVNSSTAYQIRVEYVVVNVTYLENAGYMLLGEGKDDLLFDGSFNPRLYLKDRLGPVHDHHFRVQGV